jgi:hypothetical protein
VSSEGDPEGFGRQVQGVRVHEHGYGRDGSATS